MVAWFVPLIAAGISAGGGIMAANQKNKSLERAQAILQPGRDMAATAALFAQASADPESPHNKNLTLLLQDQMRQDLLRGLRKAFTTDSRLSRRSGRAAVFLNPERRDESAARAVMDSFLQAGSLARNEAPTRLLNASGRLSEAAGAFTKSSTGGAVLEAEKGDNQARLLAMLAKTFGGQAGNIASLFGGGGGSGAFGPSLTAHPEAVGGSSAGF